MLTTTEFEPSDRYTFDFGECAPSKGFAQIDTQQEASYSGRHFSHEQHGTWANPTTLQIVCYCEGDVTRRTAEDAGEFTVAMHELRQWCHDSGHEFPGIDPMGKQSIHDAFVCLGLGCMLH